MDTNEIDIHNNTLGRKTVHAQSGQNSSEELVIFVWLFKWFTTINEHNKDDV